MSNTPDFSNLSELCKLVRYDILTSTTAAGSGHPTSSMSATELMVTVFFGGFLHYDLDNPHYILNDRVIFSKGHASPLLYSLYQAAGVVSHEELLTLRQFNSILEGHPTPRFKYIDVATGSLGQGLSVGMGMALGVKYTAKNNPVQREPKIWVLMGDSEVAEGQIWEAAEVAAHYKLNNLVGIIDVNRLGQRGETMLGWNLDVYAKRAESFGWEPVVIQDGHNLEEVYKAFEKATAAKDNPVMIIAKTEKGKGVSFLSNHDNWHGKAVPKDKLDEALKELGDVKKDLVGTVQKPEIVKISEPSSAASNSLPENYQIGGMVASREAYGHVLVELTKNYPDVVVLDAETSNSTYAETIKKTTPERFFEMYIAEQNMISAAVGFSKVGYNPFSSSFAAFFSRAFDQIRMAQYSEANIKVVGSHAGVSIGTDGSSQMALEDIAMMRTILNSIVLYPSDAVSTYKLIEQITPQKGIFFVRTTREKTPILYNNDEQFPVGGSKTVRESANDVAAIFAAGITLHEALKAYEQLKSEGINIAVIDLYSVKPIDAQKINAMVEKVKNIIVVEDHYPFGGMGEAVLSALDPTQWKTVNFIHLAVNKIPRSGTPAELLNYEEIDAEAIVKAVKNKVK